MRPVEPKTAVVTGATGQDGFYLVSRLLADGWTVHAAVRDLDRAEAMFGGHERFRAVRRDIRDPGPLRALVGDVRPEELYNLAGESSVSESFADPRATWESNAHVVVHLLDAIRLDSPGTRFYQASSGEMFGSVAGASVVHDESSALNPQSPYAAAKAAAHMLCRSYRESYGIRIACGILFNHESRHRGPQFLSRKVVDHVAGLRSGTASAPLALGNLKAERDWGFAPDYVAGMVAILRQADTRGVPDEAASYRDYVLGTGKLHAVWELARPRLRPGRPRARVGARRRRPARLVGALRVRRSRRSSSTPPSSARPTRRRSPPNPARVEAELGWTPRPGLDRFLEDMLAPQ